MPYIPPEVVERAREMDFLIQDGDSEMHRRKLGNAAYRSIRDFSKTKHRE